MEIFLAIYNDVERKLNRELHEKEKCFLEWMYERYQAEQKYKHTY